MLCVWEGGQKYRSLQNETVKAVEMCPELFRFPPLPAYLAETVWTRFLLIWQFTLFLFPYAFCPDFLRAQASNAFSHFFPVLFFLVFASCGQERIEKDTQSCALMQFKLSSLPGKKVMNCLVFFLLSSKTCKVYLSQCVQRCVNLIVIVVCFP